MVLEFLTKKKEVAKAEQGVKSPVLRKEDEDFLERLTAEAQLPPSELVLFEGNKSTDAQARLMDGADQIPLPTSPAEAERTDPLNSKVAEGQKDDKNKKKDASKRQSYLSYIQKRIPFGKEHNRKQAGTDLQTVANAVKAGDSLAPQVSPEEAEKEKQDMTKILDDLNLSAVNNRAFSFSKESQKLFDEFTQILKDIVNGVPTAYDDLEKFLTRSDKQVKDMYGNLPPFMQSFVKSLPTKMTGTLAPGLLAAASEKPGHDGQFLSEASAGTKSKIRRRVPLLKNMVKGDAIATMLKSILNFLKFRFPTFISGTNVLLSLAVFLLLFVFWYCHKRGKEVRLEKEKMASSADVEEPESDVSFETTEGDSLIIEDVSDGNANAARLQAALNQPAPPQVPLPAPKQKELASEGK
jgi:hypothetical protein